MTIRNLYTKLLGYNSSIEKSADQDSGTTLSSTKQSCAGKIPWTARVGKFGVDCIWNFGSLVVLGLSGVILNFLIAAYFGSTGLGVFNQVFAIYILCTQVATGGFPFSVQRFVPVYIQEISIALKIVVSALVLQVFWAVGISALLYSLSPAIGDILGSPSVALGLRYIVPAVLLFSLNKTFMAALNGLRHMRAYAIFQSFRFAMYLLFFFFLIQYGANERSICTLFSFGEFVLFLTLVLYFLLKFENNDFKFSRQWASKQLKFACRVFPSGFLYDMNFKVDVLLLGYFAQDSTVGVYSLAALVGEGLYMLAQVVQTNVNPLLAIAIHNGDVKAFKEMVDKSRRLFFPFMFLIGSITCILFGWLVPNVLDVNQFNKSWHFLVILTLGIVLSSSYIPFFMLLNQAGRPLSFTLMMALTVFSNIILNLFLIPLMGPLGAALAVALNYLLSVLFLKLVSFRILKIVF